MAGRHVMNSHPIGQQRAGRGGLGAGMVARACWRAGWSRRVTFEAEGGAGAEELAQAVVKLAEGEQKPLSFAYDTETKLTDKIKAIAASARVQRLGEVRRCC